MFFDVLWTCAIAGSGNFWGQLQCEAEVSKHHLTPQARQRSGASWHTAMEHWPPRCGAVWHSMAQGGTVKHGAGQVPHHCNRWLVGFHSQQRGSAYLRVLVPGYCRLQLMIGDVLSNLFQVNLSHSFTYFRTWFRRQSQGVFCVFFHVFLGRASARWFGWWRSFKTCSPSLWRLWRRTAAASCDMLWLCELWWTEGIWRDMKGCYRCRPIDGAREYQECFSCIVTAVTCCNIGWSELWRPFKIFEIFELVVHCCPHLSMMWSTGCASCRRWWTHRWYHDPPHPLSRPMAVTCRDRG